ADALWLPSWKSICSPGPRALPVASTRVALRLMVLFGPPVRAPVYVTDEPLRAMVMEPGSLDPLYSASPANEALVAYEPASRSGVYAVTAMPEELVEAEPAALPFTVNAIGLPFRLAPYSSTSEACRLLGVSKIADVAPRYPVAVSRFVTWTVRVSDELPPSLSETVRVAMKSPGAAKEWMTEGPPVADGDPSPKSQLYCRVDWSSAPGSVAWPLKATGRPQSAVVSGPALTAGSWFATVTEKLT